MMKHIRQIVVVLALTTILTACYGPSPRVVSKELQPPQTPGGPYTLYVTVQNQSNGEGQAQITARLRSRTTQLTVAEGDQTVTFQPHETIQVAFQLQVKSLGDYEATVEAQYPPQ